MHFATPSAPAVWKSASSRMIIADLPPSSSETFLTVSAATIETRLPAPFEPVNEIMSTSGCEEIASPMTEPRPLTRLKTPAGRPISWKMSASAYEMKGASTLALSTTVQPAASAPPTFRTIWCSG